MPAELLRPEPPRSWRDRARDAVEGVRQRGAAAVAGSIAGALALGVGAFVFLRTPAAPPELSLPRAEPAPATTAPPTDAVVHVAGAVAAPGVHRLRAGARVHDAVQAAGGPAPDADVDRLNLAAPVRDGDRVYVPRAGEAVDGGASTGASSEGGPLDLNTASAEQLDALPGVGPATAQAILEHRRRHGRFSSVEQLLDVSGIGEARLARLRTLVRV